MTESFIEIDRVPERDLPPHARDGRTGDRVSVLDAGLLYVRDGRGTFVPWGDVLGALEHTGQLYVLVPRRPPAAPWLEVSGSMLDSRPNALRQLKDRLEAGITGQGGGYRDAVRRRRQNLSTEALRQKVSAREPVGGALEVPSTIMLGVSYPGLAFVQLLILGVAMVGGYVGMLVPMILAADSHRGDIGPMATFFGYGLFFAALLLGAWVAIAVGRRWREAKNRTLPRQRVLVLAPDGCIVGFRTGVRALAWSDVGSFAVGHDPETYDEALVVTAPSGARLGDVQAGWLDAPLELVVSVAETYREAART